MIEESLESDDWNKVVDLVMKWVVKFAEMDRSQQVGLLMVMSVLGVRNCLLEIEGWWLRPAGVGQQHIEADGDVHYLMDGDLTVGRGCGQAAGEGGVGCPWGCGQDGGAAAGQNGMRKGSVVTYLQHSTECLLILFLFL